MKPDHGSQALGGAPEPSRRPDSSRGHAPQPHGHEPTGGDGAACDHDHDHHHDHASPAQALAAAQARCDVEGVRLTPIRKQVLAALYDAHRPLGAYDLIERLSETDKRPLAPITIYRALDFLLAQGFVHRLASRNAFVACPHGHAPHELVAFLICEGCGGVAEMSSPDIAEPLGRLLRGQGFQPRSQVIEISGICSRCGSPDQLKESARGEPAGAEAAP